jgi:hypothetical protein
LIRNKYFSAISFNGDGYADWIVGHGQSDEGLIPLGGKKGLSLKRGQRLALEYRVHTAQIGTRSVPAT